MVFKNVFLYFQLPLAAGINGCCSVLHLEFLFIQRRDRQMIEERACSSTAAKWLSNELRVNMWICGQAINQASSICVHTHGLTWRRTCKYWKSILFYYTVSTWFLSARTYILITFVATKHSFSSLLDRQKKSVVWVIWVLWLNVSGERSLTNEKPSIPILVEHSLKIANLQTHNTLWHFVSL